MERRREEASAGPTPRRSPPCSRRSPHLLSLGPPRAAPTSSPSAVARTSLLSLSAHLELADRTTHLPSALLSHPEPDPAHYPSLLCRDSPPLLRLGLLSAPISPRQAPPCRRLLFAEPLSLGSSLYPLYSLSLKPDPFHSNPTRFTQTRPEPSHPLRPVSENAGARRV